MAKSEPVAPEVIEGDASESIMEWARTNSRALSIGGMVVVALAALGLLWRASAESGNAALAQSDLQALLRRYGGTTAAIQARLVLAQVHFGQGKVDEGLRELNEIKSPGLFAASVHSMRAAGLEQAGKPGEAAPEYEKASEAASTPLAKGAYRSDAARAYLAAGNRDAAKRIWESIASDDSSPLAGEAKIRIGELTAKPIGS
jgi:tetratricopeptide (TPR) repeat protein